MKKSILILALIAICVSSFAQSKKDTVKKSPVKYAPFTNPQYNYFVAVPVGEYNNIMDELHGRKDDLIFNQALTADEKITRQVGLYAYLTKAGKNFKVDSMLIVVPDTTKKPPVKPKK